MRLPLVVAALLVAGPAFAQGITVNSAIYGGNCGRPLDATADVAARCDGRFVCNYRVNHRRIGDPAYGCAKDFQVSWSCGGYSYRGGAFPEASGKVIGLRC